MKTDDRLIFPSGDLATYENLLRLLKMIESGGGNTSPDKHLVLFEAEDGGVMMAQAVADGEQADEPSVQGVQWMKDGTPFDFSTPITENTVLLGMFDDDPAPADAN